MAQGFTSTTVPVGGPIGPMGMPGLDGTDGDDGFSIPGPVGPAAAAPPIALSWRVPTTNQTVTGGYSAVIARKYTIASGTITSVGSGGILRIL